MKYSADVTLKFKNGSTGARVLGPFDNIEHARIGADYYVASCIRYGERVSVSENNDEYCVVSHKIVLGEAVL